MPDTDFQKLIERFPGVSYVEVEGDPLSTMYLSPGIEGTLGYLPSAFLEGDFWSSLVHPDDAERVQTADRRANETRGRFCEEYRMRSADGRWVWLRDESIFAPRPEGGGAWYGLLVDITEQKDAQQELRETAATFRTLVEQIPATTYIEELGDEVRPRYVSPQYFAMFGYTAEERLADPEMFGKIIHPDDRERILPLAADIVIEDGGWSLEYRMIHRDGHTVWIRDDATLVRDESGTPIYWLGVLHDITEAKEAEAALTETLARLRNADEMKDTFLSAVSHDMRSPLAALLGSALTLEHEDELDLDPAKRRELIGAIARKARALSSLVDDLLDMERLTQGAIRPRLAAVELDVLVGGVVDACDAAQGHTIERDLRPVVIATDRTMVERIVDNLLGNAAKHTRLGSTIWVRVAPQPDGAVVRVEDDGPGVPEAIRGALFDRFTRGKTSTPGIGLGLSLVARFAEELGGRAWMEDGAHGGASFCVFLPFELDV